MYHVGRPGEDGYTDRVLKAWGVDGHNSHTNICSSSGRARLRGPGWGHDRPSADYANAEVIFLISSHLEAGHYFNPHAQRIMEGKAQGRDRDLRRSRACRTPASRADYWLRAWPGTEAALLLAIARAAARGRHRGTASSCAAGSTGSTFLAETRPDLPSRRSTTSGRPARPLRRLHARGAERESAASRRHDPRDRRDDRPPPRPRSPRTAGAPPAAGNLGGWQVARCLLLPQRAHRRRWAPRAARAPNGWNKFIPVPLEAGATRTTGGTS